MVTVVPTLAFMAGIYRLPREGGASSPRFKAYHAQVARVHGLAAYNPMAGPHALEAVDLLVALDAETVASRAAIETSERLAYPGPVTLAVVLAAPGLWTDRLATEITHRTTGARRPDHGLVLHWTREAPTVAGVRAESIAETVRVIHGAVHGPAATVRAVLAREGLAYAIADVPLEPLNDGDARMIEEALTMFGDSSSQGEIVALAHGDDTAQALGYTPLGLGPLAGVRWAAACARATIKQHGAALTLARGAPLGREAIA